MAAAIVAAIVLYVSTATAQTPIYPNAFVLSSACGTPTTPTICAATSYSIISTANGGNISFQISAISGDTVSWYASNDGLIFVPVSLANGASGAVGASVTAAGIYAGSVGGFQYIAAILTTGSTAVTIVPYLSSKGQGYLTTQTGGSVTANVSPVPLPVNCATPPAVGCPTPQPFVTAPSNGGPGLVQCAAGVNSNACGVFPAPGYSPWSVTNCGPSGVNCNDVRGANMGLTPAGKTLFGSVLGVALHVWNAVDNQYETLTQDTSNNLNVDVAAGALNQTKPLAGYSYLLDSGGTNAAGVDSGHNLQVSLCTTTGACMAFGAANGTGVLGTTPSMRSQAYLFGQNAAGTMDSVHATNQEINVDTGGQVLPTTIAAATNVGCTSLKAVPVTVHRIWSAASAETATVSLYNNASGVCGAANLVWSGIPSNTVPVWLDAAFTLGIAYKTSAATVNNTWISTN